MKGVFGLADALREWYLRLHREVSAEGWVRSSLDLALWLRCGPRDPLEEVNYVEATPQLQGAMLAHVDDLLFTGNAEAEESLKHLGDRLGFGSLEEGLFVWCGKRFVKDKVTGEVKMDMNTYHQNQSTIPLNRERRKNPAALKGLLGLLQWLTGQLRMDISFGVSSLQSEKPTVGTALRANKLALEAKKHSDFTRTFRDVNIFEAGILVITDAALGNVTADGCVEGSIQEKVHSQSCYAVLLANQSMMEGGVGTFNILDFRSHRMARVCRSSYAAEIDAGELCFAEASWPSSEASTCPTRWHIGMCAESKWLESPTPRTSTTG